MANATPRDARAGYGLYRRVGGELTLDQLNRRLVDSGYGPVSQRMFSHYRRLANAGYTHYISINRFDVANAATPYGDLGASPRYAYTSTGEGVRLLIAKRSKLWAANATVESASEAGALLRFVDPEYAAGLISQKVRAGDAVSLHLLESGRFVEGIITEMDLVSSPPLVEIRFDELVSLVDLDVGQTGPSTSIGLRVRSSSDDSGATTDQIGRRLHHVFDLIEEFRAILNAISRDNPSIVSYSSPVIVEQLRVQSPMELVLLVSNSLAELLPWGELAALVRALSHIPEKRKTWLEGAAIQIDNRAQELAAEERRERASRNREIDTLVMQLIAALSDAGASAEEVATAEATIRRQVIPLLEALAEAGVEGFEELEIDGEGSESLHGPRT